MEERSLADTEGMARQILSLSIPACFVIFPERKDETRLRPGGNVFSLHGCGAGAGGLIKSIFLPQCHRERGDERKDTEEERAGPAVGGYPID